MNLRKSLLAVGITSAIFSSGAQAVNWQAGDWTLGLGGNVNAFYIHTACSNGDLGAGGATLSGLACGTSTDANGNFEDANAVTNGLLPSSLNFSAGTSQNDWDLSAHINVYYGAASNTALGFSTVDARQVYVTLGNEDVGSFLIGRNFGLFGFDAIINDTSLLGGGAAFTTATPGHTTLGGLGYGYVYTDRLAQMNYTTPTFGGFTGTLGIFSPLSGVATAGVANNGGSIGYHAKGSYSWEGNVGGTVSASFINQEMDLTGPGTTADVTGWDVFGKVKVNDFDFVAYYFDGEGMTTLALGGLVFPGFNGVTGAAEESNGYMLQGQYTMGSTRFAVNWSASEQEQVTLVENEKLTLGVYHNLTPSLTLVGEFSDQESTLSGVGTDESWNVNLGAIMFF